MKILSFDCHEALLCAWAKLGFQIDLLPYIKEWKWNEKKRPLPENVRLLPDAVINPEDYQFAVAFNEHKQAPIVRELGIPYMISLASSHRVMNMKKLQTEPVAFCAYSQKEALGFGGTEAPVMHYPIDLDEFRGYTGDGDGILSTINYFRQKCNRVVRGYDWAMQITKGLPYFNVGWELEGDFIAAYDFEALKGNYRNRAVYLDPCTASPMSMSCLEAMATGMPFVTRPHDDWPFLIEHGINGVMSNDDGTTRQWLESLLEDGKTRAALGRNAREMIREKFSVEAWKKDWMIFFAKWNLI